MRKSEIIEATLRDMRGKWQSPESEAGGPADDKRREQYDAFVIQTLTDRLPDDDLATCTDFRHLGVDCCEGCHHYAPYADLHIEHLPDGGKAWICCSVRRALRGESSEPDDDQDSDLDQALGG